MYEGRDFFGNGDGMRGIRSYFISWIETCLCGEVRRIDKWCKRRRGRSSMFEEKETNQVRQKTTVSSDDDNDDDNELVISGSCHFKYNNRQSNDVLQSIMGPLPQAKNRKLPDTPPPAPAPTQPRTDRNTHTLVKQFKPSFPISAFFLFFLLACLLSYQHIFLLFMA